MTVTARSAYKKQTGNIEISVNAEFSISGVSIGRL